ncbi:MAG: AbiEi antitoxin N-terminal domain-containing protein [Silvanigrellales bacterium]|jgi:predicted transcriptional regulator of viral defense system|nr:AbiEi antitoxin N-terminal domain-containing protein [Silvanigrellales bacterium]
METNEQQILDLVRARGLVRARDLAERGLPRVTLTRMVQSGVLVRVGRGLYALPSRATSEHGFIAEAATKAPSAVVCLLSALRIHSLTTQSPFEVWLAMPIKARAPRSAGIPVRVMRFSETCMNAGLETKEIDGFEVRVTNVAKTVADCFKFRNKIGLDVALEALREAWQAKRVTMDDLWHFAGICRVTNVMRPYLESLT